MYSLKYLNFHFNKKYAWAEPQLKSTAATEPQPNSTCGESQPKPKAKKLKGYI